MATVSMHVPDDWEYKKKFDDVVSSKKYKGVPGRYLRDAIERDLEGSFVPSNKTVLVDLAHQFHPTLAFAFENEFGHRDQPIVVMRFLEALLEANRVEGFKPENKFRLFNSTEQMAATLAKLGVLEKMSFMYDAVVETVESNPLAGEPPQAPYDATKKVVDSLKKKAATNPAPHTPPPTLPKPKPPGRP